MREVLMRVEPNSMPSTASPDRIDSAVLLECGFTDATSGRSLLLVVGVLPVFSLEMLLDQALRERSRRWCERLGDERHARELFQHGCVVDGLLRRLAPGEWRVTGHQHHGGVQRVAVLEAL